MSRLIKTTEEINMIREGGHILGQILEDVSALVSPGIETKDLEDRALELIEKAGGRPAFKGYKPDKHSKPFPSALCISVNEEIVHGPAVPSRKLEEGQIVTLDIGMEYPFVKGKKVIIQTWRQLWPLVIFLLRQECYWLAQKNL